MKLTTLNNNLTLLDIANCPSNYQPEVKAAALDTIKQMKKQLRDIEIAISSNVIHEMTVDLATKILFVDTKGESHTLTLKSAGKKINPNIKSIEQFVTENGYPNLVETEVVPLSWSKCKELRKQGGKIQEVIDHIYVDDKQSIEIK